MSKLMAGGYWDTVAKLEAEKRKLMAYRKAVKNYLYDYYRDCDGKGDIINDINAEYRRLLRGVK